ncbi:hypothetical protein K3495_g7930 [Podosphaera aphanis]|nr:hypothetical protein K3495_g7930 [Podosphaera aphanis]
MVAAHANLHRVCDDDDDDDRFATRRRRRPLLSESIPGSNPRTSVPRASSARASMQRDRLATKRNRSNTTATSTPRGVAPSPRDRRGHTRPASRSDKSHRSRAHLIETFPRPYR